MAHSKQLQMDYNFKIKGTNLVYGFKHHGYRLRRARALIFVNVVHVNPAYNITPEKGQIFVRSSKQCCQHMGVNGRMIRVCENYTIQEIQDVCIEEAGRIVGRREREMFLIFYFGHGGTDNKLMARNGIFDPFTIIVPAFEKETAHNLAGRPKLMFINSCSGTIPNAVVPNAPPIVVNVAAVNPLMEPLIATFDNRVRTQRELDELHTATPSGADWVIFRGSVPGYTLANRGRRNTPFMMALESSLVKAKQSKKHFEIYDIFLKLQRALVQFILSRPAPSTDKFRNIASFFTSNRKKLYPCG